VAPRSSILPATLIAVILSFPAASEEVTVHNADIACRDPTILDRVLEMQRNNDPDAMTALVLSKLTTGDCIEIKSGETVIVFQRGPFKTKVSASGRTGEYWIMDRALQ
jgi:hypothetical protein